MKIPGVRWYGLNPDHTICVFDDVIEWGRWWEVTENRRVAETELFDGRWISTVFLGIDHQWHSSGPPILFETMVFPSKDREDRNEEHCERYATWDEAYTGHWRIVRDRTLHLCEESG